MTTRPTTPRAALLAFADHLDEAPDDATWLPPRSVARLIREHAEHYPADAEPESAPAPDPDRVEITWPGSNLGASLVLGGVDVTRWVTRADVQLDARDIPKLHVDLDVPGVVAHIAGSREVAARVDDGLAALLYAAGWTYRGHP